MRLIGIHSRSLRLLGQELRGWGRDLPDRLFSRSFHCSEYRSHGVFCRTADDSGKEHFYPIFSDWENQVKGPEWKSQFPNLPFANKPRVTEKEYIDKLKQVSGQAILP